MVAPVSVNTIFVRASCVRLMCPASLKLMTEIVWRFSSSPLQSLVLLLKTKCMHTGRTDKQWQCQMSRSVYGLVHVWYMMFPRILDFAFIDFLCCFGFWHIVDRHGWTLCANCAVYSEQMLMDVRVRTLYHTLRTCWNPKSVMHRMSQASESLRHVFEQCIA